MARPNLDSYAAAVGYYETLAPAPRHRTVPNSRQMRGEATHRRVRLNANTGDVECFFKRELLAAHHPDNSVTIYRGCMSQTDMQHHRRVLPNTIHSDVGFSGGPVVTLKAAGDIWRTGHAYYVPAAGLRVTLGDLPTIHPDSARQSFVTYTVDRRKAAAKRKEHGVDDFIAWATMTAALNPGLLKRPPSRWTSVPAPRSERASDVLRDLADRSGWQAFCEHYKHNTIAAARLAVIDMYDCWTITEVPVITSGWIGVRSWRGQCREYAASSRRKD